ncbi:bifunctional 2-polyprenyl-6-hydroxyphenol methylase/3-demethylubiquinol 3-O-methyltransferase UbiG [Varunaivibrio sulfuroxidans]|uniref:Ubiquinone biosynthesis O-methyltransferase n=1 Tax=Varunaivibrio sulfuroxidans TaxID=1773489 RepID=A0A4R3JGM3_9PROT|nr:bifunctional 2-polyprenyl-6-hydroxyphenol methylase/3-demethylubiquinol 3-O-methyltransferase UbiG [Varunaivibrio sulfuroxidans]TCS65094.1 3-demethylubiquinone-9 3-methyltransferase [Varunaivibrio sulfuroxidans]WES29620.1 bifunctional 2-polyprenyl-6-hydroxyphenol methylase/3-demethylubiquinol 3-O-methyltransferase UbiG [Varunaivibrio sulfuroxidans]
MTSDADAQTATTRHDAPPGTHAANTVSEDEVARFTAIAESWWDAKGKFRPLHQINPVRIAYIRDHVCARLGRDPLAPHPLEGLTLLDIGSGGGLLCEPMRRLGARVTGIDAGERNVAVAKIHAEQSGLDIDYRHIPPEILAQSGETFDVVLNMEVVEHVSDLDLFIESSAALVKPGGAMVVTTLNRTLKSLALAKIGAEYLLRWLPPGTHDWRKFVKPSELAHLLRVHGLILDDLSGMAYGAMKDEWFLSPNDLAVNYLAFAHKP